MNKRNHLALYILFILCSINCFAQDTSPDNTHNSSLNIHVTVHDLAASEADVIIAYWVANIKKWMLIEQFRTNKKGNISFKNLEAGKYKVFGSIKNTTSYYKSSKEIILDTDQSLDIELILK